MAEATAVANPTQIIAEKEVDASNADNATVTTDSGFFAFIDFLGAPDSKSSTQLPEVIPPTEVTVTKNHRFRCSKCEYTQIGSFPVLNGVHEHTCYKCHKNFCDGCANATSDNDHRYLHWCGICDQDYCLVCRTSNSCDECGLDCCSGCIETCAKCNKDLCAKCSTVKECVDCGDELCNDCRYTNCRKDYSENSCIGCLKLCTATIFPKLQLDNEMEQEQLRKEIQQLRIENEDLKGEINILHEKHLLPLD